LRTSPGGTIPSCRRSRPEEPPSSAMAMIAVGRAPASRKADSVAARPRPPPMATMGTSLSVRWSLSVVGVDLLVSASPSYRDRGRATLQATLTKGVDGDVVEGGHHGVRARLGEQRLVVQPGHAEGGHPTRLGRLHTR
jgi:hypothetical protein